MDVNQFMIIKLSLLERGIRRSMANQVSQQLERLWSVKTSGFKNLAVLAGKTVRFENSGSAVLSSP